MEVSESTKSNSASATLVRKYLNISLFPMQDSPMNWSLTWGLLLRIVIR